MKYIYIAIVCILLMHTKLHAAEIWTGYHNVNFLYPSASGLIIISEYSNSERSSCDNGKRYLINKSHPNYDTLVSSMLMAFASDKKLTFVINDSQPRTCSPDINRFIIAK